MALNSFVQSGGFRGDVGLISHDLGPDIGYTCLYIGFRRLNAALRSRIGNKRQLLADRVANAEAKDHRPQIAVVFRSPEPVIHCNYPRILVNSCPLPVAACPLIVPTTFWPVTPCPLP